MTLFLEFKQLGYLVTWKKGLLIKRGYCQLSGLLVNDTTIFETFLKCCDYNIPGLNHDLDLKTHDTISQGQIKSAPQIKLKIT